MKKPVVDKNACTGAAVCVAVAPEVFDLDEGGKAFVKDPEGADDAETLALVVDDPDAPDGVFDHWIIWGISADVGEIPEGVPSGEEVDSLGGALQGQNGFGEIGYRGPCPPGGPDHDYRFKLYALDSALDLVPGIRKEDLEMRMEGHIVAESQIVGTYGR